MTTDPSISVIIQDEDAILYTLDSNKVPFGRVALREEKIVLVVLKNNTLTSANNITVEAIQHPTGQVGRDADTWQAVEVGETDAGPWFNILDIPLLNPGATKDIYLNWTVPEEAIPGAAVFAIEIKGDVDL